MMYKGMTYELSSFRFSYMILRYISIGRVQTSPEEDLVFSYSRVCAGLECRDVVFFKV